MSALPPKADISLSTIVMSALCQKQTFDCYSINSSARPDRGNGTDDEHDAAGRFGASGNNPHRCSVAFHDVSGTGLSSALFTNSTESIAAPS
jgi:hypothetical protein